MPVYVLNPYVAEVADALKAAGVPVTETWTEPVVPLDHCIGIDVAAGGSVHLVWEDGPRGWRFFIYSPARFATGVPTAGTLLPHSGSRPAVFRVVDAAQDLLKQLAQAGT